MKKILLTFVILGILVWSPASAETSLSVISASSNVDLSKSFTGSLKLDPAGYKVCVIKGALTFNNLSCQTISVANGLMAQVSPTCANPNFTLGIPNCSSDVQNLLTFSVKGKSAGDASVGITGGKVIGGGNDIVFAAKNGIFNISAAQAVEPKPEEKPVQKTVKPAPVQEEILTIEEEPVQTTEEPAEEEEEEDGFIQTTSITPEETASASLLSTVKNFALSPSGIISLLVALLLVLWLAQTKFIARLFSRNKNIPNP